MAAMATSVWLSLVCTVSSEIMSPGSATRSMEEVAGFAAVWVVGAAVAAGAVTAGAACVGAAATCVGAWGGWVGAGAAAARIRFQRWRSASDEPSSIDGYHLAGNVRGLVRCQVDHRLRDILGQY